MKISCPNCGRDYALPQDVIDHILKENQPKPHTPEQEFFAHVSTDSEATTPVLEHGGIFHVTHRTTDNVARAVLALGGLSVLAVLLVAFYSADASTGVPASTAASRLTIFVGLAVGFYLIPTIVALLRRHPNAGAIAAVNILLGWTVLGYVAALVWSMTAITDSIRGTAFSRFR